MRRGRLLILVGILLLLVTVAVFLFLRPFLSPPPESEVSPEAAEATPVPAELVDVVVAGQDLLRGATISAEALVTYPWPVSAVPPGAVTDKELLVGKKARADILRGEPVLESMVVETVADLTAEGSYPALSIPPGHVAIAVPVNRFSGVAQALQPGDRVDVLLTMLFVDLDEDTQSRLPSQTGRVIPPSFNPETGEETLTMDVQAGGEGSEAGRAENDPILGEPVYLVPSEPQRPRMVTQMIVQDAMVLNVGEFTESDRLGPQLATPTPEAEAVGQPPPEGEQPPPPSPPARDIVTLVVTRQDALVLDYANQAFWSGTADLMLVLRSAGDTAQVLTESVTLQYLIDRFEISVPSRQPYGLEPRQDTLTQPPTPEPTPAPGS